MNIFIAGATGRVAQFLIEELVDKGHQVTAGARNPERIDVKEGVRPLPLDLHAGVEDLSQLLQGQEAVYFVAGSRGKDLLQTDAFGAVKMMQAAELVGIKRFVLLSSIFATEPERWSDPNLVSIMDYNIAKFFADNWLIHNTKLDYTILQPGNLVEAETASGKIAIHVKQSQPNSIPNVAATLAAILESSNTYQKIIQMSDGDVPIELAIQNV
ncbi:MULTISPECIES: NAD(P)H-binding protein [unclassified Streptococcus]|uniref:NAD(P)H-binding protein n=1 Tax=unclassified Streptococcus TaxID=2608887 RepID=UPI001072B330|nr:MULTISPECIES: NAD(P)H-binding protein [unclassified Streptococcus]MBF0805871.1 NAD(P)H-binding protein [Streptococcus sp. 19428wA2_WM07]TFU28548.1 NAD(P)-dependent oxidoreductase [Streptococcus sp. WM07]